MDRVGNRIFATTLAKCGLVLTTLYVCCVITGSTISLRLCCTTKLGEVLMKFLLASLLFVFPIFVFANSWLCVAEKVVGFDSANDFKPRSFKAKNKWVIRPGEETEYEIAMMGIPRASIFLESQDDGMMWFEGSHQFTVNTKTLKYTVNMSFGFDDWTDSKKIGGGVGGPKIEIGKCTKID